MRFLIRKLIIRLTSYVYLVMVCGQLLTPFIQLSTNSDCIEGAQGNKMVWLSVQTIIKLAEAILVIQCLTVPQKVKRLLFFRKCWSSSKSSQLLQQTRFTEADFYSENRSPNDNYKNLETKYIKGLSDRDVEKVYNFQEKRDDYDVHMSTEHKLVEALEVTLHHSNLASTRSPCQLIECVNNKTLDTVVEREILSQASSSNVGDILKVHSYCVPPRKLEHEFQGDQLLNSFF